MNDIDKTKVIKTLSKLGLSEEQSSAYLLILQNPEITVSKLAKELGIGRTKTYRILDNLKDLNLLSEVKTQSGSVFSAQSYENLESLISVRESEIKQMKSSFEGLKSLLDLSEEEKSKSGITSFSGEAGLKQVIWNTTKAKGVLKVFESERLNQFMDFGFADDVRMEYLKKRIRTKDLTNERKIEGWTNLQQFSDELAEARYISKEELNMDFEIYIYNDVVTLNDYRGDELFCLEIRNIAIKTLMENLFDFVWNRAAIMKITGPRGEMEVEG